MLRLYFCSYSYCRTSAQTEQKPFFPPKITLCLGRDLISGKPNPSWLPLGGVLLHQDNPQLGSAQRSFTHYFIRFYFIKGGQMLAGINELNATAAKCSTL
jgi:hypothetical protein